MVKVLINRNPRRNQAWGGGAHFVNAFHDHAKDAGVEIVKSLSMSPDVIFVFHPDSEDGTISYTDALEYKRLNPRVRLVVRVNECDARKGTCGVDDKWIHMIEQSDHAFYVSSWMKQYYDSKMRFPQKGSVTINGIDRERFEVHEKKISEWTGKTAIVCAHWSDNKLKGEEVYEFIDDFVSRNPDFSFTFIGRTKAALPHSKILPPMDPVQLARSLTAYDICVNGTFWDPGPNAVIESIAAGLPTYVHDRSGGAADFAGQDHVFKSLPQLEEILLSKDYLKNKDEFLDWKSAMKPVYDKIKALGMTIKDRVDILMEVGVDHPKKWATVHGYQNPSEDLDRCSDWYSEWQRLREHHLDETLFLFDVIKELRERLKKAQSK